MSGYCTPCHTADVEDMYLGLFVSHLFFSFLFFFNFISVLNTLVEISVSVFWLILSKPISVINIQKKFQVTGNPQ